MPDIPFFVPPPIVTIIGPNGEEIHGTEAIRKHMEQLTETERDKYRCILQSGFKTWWIRILDPDAP
jgi:hypothetical protein